MAVSLWRINVDVPEALAEAVGDVLGEGALALSTMQSPRTTICQIEAIFDHEPQAAPYVTALAVLAATQGLSAPDLRIEAVPQTDWLAKVARDFPPIRAGRLVVHGAHDRGKIPFWQKSLQIEAATAFGTGEHPTTFGCLLALDTHLKRTMPRRALDMGCGSGILALALARLARRKSVGIDIDAESVRMARHNARVNGLGRLTHFVAGDGYLAQAARRGRPYDLILANIFARPLASMARPLRAHLAPGGVAILSGLLTSQENMVLAVHRAQRLHLIRRIRFGEWSVLVLQRRARID